MSALVIGYECEKVFMGEGTPTAEEFWKIAKDDHPGVQMVMEQKDVNLAGPVKVLSEGEYPTRYAGVYMRPEESRKIFEERGWSEVAALQLRNPMHRSHEYLCKIAVEVCDGVYIHSLVGNLKPGDIPAAIEEHYRPTRSGSALPATRAGALVSIADKLDSIGAIGVARAFLFAGELGARLHNPTLDAEKSKPYSIDDTGYREFKVKLSKIKARMLTESGRKWARDRHAFMDQFFNRFLAEYEGKR